MGLAVAGSLTTKENLPGLVAELAKPTAEGFSRMASEFKVTPCYYGNNVRHKINTLCCKCITDTAPSYLCDCLQLYTPSRTLRSSSGTPSLQIPRTRLATVGSRAFSVFGPSTWNDLPLPRRQKPSLDSFKSNLKTFPFPEL